MGYYINEIGISYREKIQSLKVDHGGIVIDPPEFWCQDLVCVVDNITFGAACWINNESEFRQWKVNDGRPRCWMIVPNANQLSR